MVRTVVYTPEAEDDVVEAYTWYEARSPGLGERRIAPRAVASAWRSPLR